DAIVGDDLDRRVLLDDGQVERDVGAQGRAPGEVEAGAEVERGNARVVEPLAGLRVLSLGLAREDSLDAERVAVRQEREDTRAPDPGEVVGVLVLEVSLAPNRELRR